VILDLKESFYSQRNAEVAEQQKAYMKDLFPYIGLKKPLRASLQKKIFSSFAIKEEKQLLELILGLWKEEEREFQYAAMDLAIKHRKLLTSKSLPILEKLIRSKSWWDTVDTLASNLLGPILYKYAENIPLMDAWIEDEDFWIRRSALLYQLKWKKGTDEKKLFLFCEKQMGEKEFFIRKAIGWVLREYSKTSPEAVRAFVDKHQDTLSGLSKREASKYL
jgi:3-methyladenine DNA glycosylase AlkD